MALTIITKISLMVKEGITKETFEKIYDMEEGK